MFNCWRFWSIWYLFKSNLIKKNYDIQITTRSVSKTKKKLRDLKINKIKVINLNILNKKKF